MIKSGSHLEKIIKQLAAKKRMSPEEYLATLLNEDYKSAFKKSYLL